MKNFKKFKLIFVFWICILNVNKIEAQCSGFNITISKIGDGSQIHDVVLLSTIIGSSGKYHLSFSDTGFIINNSIDSFYNMAQDSGLHCVYIYDSIFGCSDTACISVSDTLYWCDIVEYDLMELDGCRLNDVKLIVDIFTPGPPIMIHHTVKWNTGDSVKIISNKTNGSFSVIVYDTLNGCIDTMYHTVMDDSCDLCAGHTLSLFEIYDKCKLNDVRYEFEINTGTYHKFLWSNGDTQAYADSLTTGNYSLIARDTILGCIDTFMFNVIDDSCNPCDSFYNYATIHDNCKPNDVSIYLHTKDTNVYCSYIWNNGLTTKNIYSQSTGIHKVYILDTLNLCYDTLVLNIKDTTYKCCRSKFYVGEDSLGVISSTNVIDFFNYYNSLSNSASSSISKYLWSFGDGIQDTGFHTSHIYSTTGAKTICHYIETLDSCKDTSCITRNLPPIGMNLTVSNFVNNYVIGQPQYYKIFYSNKGSNIVNGVTIEFRYPIGMNFISSNLNPSTHSGNKMIFSIGTLNIGQSGWLNLNFHTPANYVFNSWKNDTTIIFPKINEIDSLNNEILNSSLVVSSYDPNNKIVSPKGYKDKGGIYESTKELNYLINFQNEGNWRTYQVRVEDEINDNFDLNSLIIGESSHEYRLVKLGQKLIWNFDDIELLPSSVNEEKSKGFIQYSLKLKDELPIGTKITNQASIYFDFNLPIYTNTTINTIIHKSNSKIKDVPSEFSIYPNPASSIITIESKSKMISFEIYDMVGRLVKSEKLILNNKIDVSKLESGIYLLKLLDEHGKGIQKKFEVRK